MCEMLCNVIAGLSSEPTANHTEKPGIMFQTASLIPVGIIFGYALLLLDYQVITITHRSSERQVEALS